MLEVLRCGVGDTVEVGLIGMRNGCHRTRPNTNADTTTDTVVHGPVGKIKIGIELVVYP